MAILQSPVGSAVTLRSAASLQAHSAVSTSSSGIGNAKGAVSHYSGAGALIEGGGWKDEKGLVGLPPVDSSFLTIPALAKVPQSIETD